MTRKDYIAIAAVVRSATKDETPEMMYKGFLVGKLVELFEQDNPKFDTEKFMQACYRKEDSDEVQSM